MNRRGFLSFLGAAVVVVQADPDRLVWTPGAKLISIPAPDDMRKLMSVTDYQNLFFDVLDRMIYGYYAGLPAVK